MTRYLSPPSTNLLLSLPTGNWPWLPPPTSPPLLYLRPRRRLAPMRLDEELGFFPPSFTSTCPCPRQALIFSFLFFHLKNVWCEVGCCAGFYLTNCELELWQAPLIYSPAYDITFLGIEKL